MNLATSFKFLYFFLLYFLPSNDTNKEVDVMLDYKLIKRRINFKCSQRYSKLDRVYSIIVNGLLMYNLVSLEIKQNKNPKQRFLQEFSFQK